MISFSPSFTSHYQIQIDSIIENMNKKLSIKTIHTFGGQNPFLRSPSNSSRPNHPPVPFQPRSSNYGNSSYQKTSSIVNSFDSNSPFKSPSHKPIFKSDRNRLCKEYQMGNKCGSFNRNKSPLKIHDYSCEDIIFLLKHEKENLAKVKETVENDNKKIEEHFDDFKKSICNMADDLKLSIKAHMNSQYQHFVDQFKVLKIQFGNYCNTKQQFWNIKNSNTREQMANEELLGTLKHQSDKNGKQLSNEDLVYSLMDDIQVCRKHIKYEEFSHIQQKILKPILLQSQQMARQLSVETYYRPEISHQTFKKLYQAIQVQFHGMYEKMDLFMTDYLHSNKISGQDLSVQRNDRRENSKNSHYSRGYDKSEKAEGKIYTNKYHKAKKNGKSQPCSHYLSNQSENNGDFIIYSQKQDSKASFVSPVFHQSDSQLKKSVGQEVEIIYNMKRSNEITTDKVNQEEDHSTALNTYGSSFKSSLRNNSVNEAMYAPDGYKVGRDSISGQPTLVFNQSKNRKSFESAPVRDLNSESNFSLQENGKICDQIPLSRKKEQHGQVQTALCLVQMKKMNRIAVGTKNGSIKVFCLKTGTKLEELLEHTGGVCSLAFLTGTSMLISGGDMGCCRVITWDFQKQHSGNFMQILPRKHSAAVTSVLDLEDGKHIISGSFDSNINIYNGKSKDLVCSTCTNEKITQILLLRNLGASNNIGKNSICIVVGHLSNALSIWELAKNSFNSVTGVQQIRKITIGSFPQSMRQSGSEIIVSGKDKWIRKISLNSFSVEQAEQLPQVCQQLIQIDKNTFICCLRNGDFYLLQTGNQMSYEKIGQGCGISYSCGINPKYMICGQKNNKELYVSNHKNTTQTQINKWKIYSH